MRHLKRFLLALGILCTSIFGLLIILGQDHKPKTIKGNRYITLQDVWSKLELE